MINSVPALCRAVGASLRENVLPHLSDPYARGQLAAAAMSAVARAKHVVKHNQALLWLAEGLRKALR